MKAFNKLDRKIRKDRNDFTDATALDGLWIGFLYTLKVVTVPYAWTVGGLRWLSANVGTPKTTKETNAQISKTFRDASKDSIKDISKEIAKIDRAIKKQSAKSTDKAARELESLLDEREDALQRLRRNQHLVATYSKKIRRNAK